MITVGSVRDALRDRFGSALVEDPGFAEGIVQTLSSYASWKDTFASLSRRMEDDLFNALYERLGPAMTLRLDDGTPRRIHMADLPAAADEAMYPFFLSLNPYSVNYDHLHAYWMETGSLSAMRALYVNFSDFLPTQERFLIERTARENLPPALADAWFPGHNDAC